jgi:hypothetical protein
MFVDNMASQTGARRLVKRTLPFRNDRTTAYLLFRFNVLVNGKDRATRTVFQGANRFHDELQSRHVLVLLLMKAVGSTLGPLENEKSK